MNRLSERNAELVFGHRAASGVHETWRPNAPLGVAALAALRAHPEPAVVPWLLSSLLATNFYVARAAADTVSAALAVARALDFVELDDACRRHGSYVPARESAWRSLRPAALSRFDTFGDAEVSAVGVASFHGDGFVREAAVERLDSLATPRSLPFLLVRLNDWVTPVAERARTAVARRVTSDHADAFVDYLPLVLRLGGGTRRSQRDLLEQVYAMLAAPEKRAALHRGLGAPDRSTRRALFAVAYRAAGPAPADAVRRALRDPDPVIRIRAVAAARARIGDDDEQLVPLVAEMLRDPYAGVRREALAAAAAVGLAGVDGQIRAALLDPNQVVREVARFYAVRRGVESDVAAFYRDHLRSTTHPRELAAAVAGLGETGAAGDAGLVLPLLEHERAYVRAAAVRALASLDADGQLGRVIGALADASAAVSHTARLSLRTRAGRVGGEALSRLMRESPYAHGRADALIVATRLGKWDSVPVLVEGCASSDARVRSLATVHLDAWVAKQNRSSAPPTRSQLDAIGAALRAHRPAVASGVVRELEAILRFWEA